MRKFMLLTIILACTFLLSAQNNGFSKLKPVETHEFAGIRYSSRVVNKTTEVPDSILVFLVQLELDGTVK